MVAWTMMVVVEVVRRSKVQNKLSASLSCLYECVQIPIPVFTAENRLLHIGLGCIVRPALYLPGLFPYTQASLK